MLQLDPSDPLDLTFALKKAMKLSGLSLAEIVERLKQDYGAEITPSGLSHGINRGAIRFQRALQILAAFTWNGWQVSPSLQAVTVSAHGGLLKRVGQMAILLVRKELPVTLDALCRPFQDHAVSQLEVKIARPF